MEADWEEVLDGTLYALDQRDADEPVIIAASRREASDYEV